MVLRTKEEWTNFLIAAGIPQEDAAAYANAFIQNCLTKLSLPDLSKEYLQDLGITIIGDVIMLNNNHQVPPHQMSTHMKQLSNQPALPLLNFKQK